MAIKIPQGYEVTSHEPIDTRFALTYNEMVTCRDEFMPAVYFTLIKDADSEDEGIIYVYNRLNNSIPKYGRFRPASVKDLDYEKLVNLPKINHIPVEGDLPLFGETFDQVDQTFDVKVPLPVPEDSDIGNAAIVQPDKTIAYETFVKDVFITDESIVDDHIARFDIGEGLTFNDRTLAVDTDKFATKSELAVEVAKLEVTDSELKAADADLLAKIDAEIEARESADEELEDEINSESFIRERDDNEIRADLANEVTARIAGDETLQVVLDNEKADRIDADAKKQDKLKAGAAIKITAETDGTELIQVTLANNTIQVSADGLYVDERELDLDNNPDYKHVHDTMFFTSEGVEHNQFDILQNKVINLDNKMQPHLFVDSEPLLNHHYTRPSTALFASEGATFGNTLYAHVSNEDRVKWNAKQEVLAREDTTNKQVVTVGTSGAANVVSLHDDKLGVWIDNSTIKYSNSELCLYAVGAIGAPSTADNGKVLKVTIDPVKGPTPVWTVDDGGKVQDVKVVGTSVLNTVTGIAEINKATADSYGAVKLDATTIKDESGKIVVDALAAINKMSPIAGNAKKALVVSDDGSSLTWGEAGKVEDVKIGTESLLNTTTKIATIPVAAASTLGVVKTQANGTIAVDGAGTLSAVVDTASGLKITTNGIAADDTKLQKKLTADSPIEITTADHIKLNSGSGLEVASNKLVVKPDNTPLEGITVSVSSEGVHAKVEVDDTLQVIATGADKGKLSVKDVKLDILKNKTTAAYKADGDKLSTYIKPTLGDNLANPGDPALYNDIVLTEDLIAAVSQNLGVFRGTHNSEGDLPTAADNNDYAFVVDDSTPGMVYYKRYKFDGTQWKYEYTLANTSYTTAQWNALNSGATSTIISSVNGKQDQVVATAPITLDADGKTLSLDYDTTTLTVASNKLAGNYTASNGVKLVGADIQAAVDGTTIVIDANGKLTAGGAAPHEHANKATLDKIQNPTAADVGKALVYNGSTIGWGEAGQVDDVKVNGTSVVTSKTAAITTPAAGTSGQIWVSSGSTAGTGVTMPGSWQSAASTISSASTATDIPSAKAVYDYAQAKLTGEKGIEITTANKIGHKETYTEATTSAIYPIKVDSYGHVSDIGTAFDPAGIARWATAANDSLQIPDPVAGQFISYDGTTKKLIWKAGGGGGTATYVEGTNIELVPDPTTGEVTINVVGVPVYQAGSGINISGNIISTVAANPSFSQLTGSPDDNAALKDALDAKQATLTAGDYISISASGSDLVISATGLPEFKESDSIAIADDGTISVAAAIEAGDGIKITGNLADGTVTVAQDVLTTLNIGSNKVPTSKAVADYIATLNHKTKQTAIDTSTAAVSGQATDAIVGFKQNANGEITDVVRKSLGGTPSDAKIDFQINGTSKGSFTLNQTAAGTINYAPSWNDLSDKPTIPTVNDGTLTLQNSDGTKTYGSFKANQATNSIIKLPAGTVADIERW